MTTTQKNIINKIINIFEKLFLYSFTRQNLVKQVNIIRYSNVVKETINIFFKFL